MGGLLRSVQSCGAYSRDARADRLPRARLDSNPFSARASNNMEQDDESSPSLEDLQTLIQQLRAENSSLRVQLARAGLEYKAPQRAPGSSKRPQKFRVTLPNSRTPGAAWLGLGWSRDLRAGAGLSGQVTDILHEPSPFKYTRSQQGGHEDGGERRRSAGAPHPRQCTCEAGRWNCVALAARAQFLGPAGAPHPRGGAGASPGAGEASRVPRPPEHRPHLRRDGARRQGGCAVAARQSLHGSACFGRTTGSFKVPWQDAPRGLILFFLSTIARPAGSATW